jgi:excisionase family DNA binding protein
MPIVAALVDALDPELLADAQRAQCASPKQICALLNISDPTLYALFRSGELPNFRVNGARRVLISDLLEYIDRQKATDKTWSI